MEVWAWIGFVLFVLVMLAVDLGVLNRKAHVISTREALLWAGFCCLLALLFTIAVYFIYEYHWLDIGADAEPHLSGRQAAVQFVTGWIIEQSLSLDNIFVIAIIFGYFCVPLRFQHRCLFWGILGALIMRGIMIALGAALIQRFNWITYVFGGLLLVTALRMLTATGEGVDPDRNFLVRLARRLYPVTRDFEGEKFFTRIDGRRAITPMFLVLLVIESTDVLFAVDSIPAIFAVTREPFLVFTSNVFAILNLRSLYFVLAGALDRFRFLKPSLVLILAFVGVKMLLHGVWHPAEWIPLSIVGGVILVGILASLLSPPKALPSAKTSATAPDPGADA